MKNREQKQKEVETLRADLEHVPNVLVSEFSKVTVAQEYELRKQVRTAGGRYRVVKNTVAERAARGTAAESALKNLVGPTALACTEKDPVALAKILVAYAKANPSFAFKAGVVEGRAVSIQEIGELATLPGREELVVRVLYMLNAPARGVASAVAAVARSLASVVHQAVEANKFAE